MINCSRSITGHWVTYRILTLPEPLLARKLCRAINFKLDEQRRCMSYSGSDGNRDNDPKFPTFFSTI